MSFFIQAQGSGWPYGVMGPLIVLNGQTVALNPGGVYDYSFVRIDLGGTLKINNTGGDWVVLGCKGVFTVNGRVEGRLGEHTGGTWATASPIFDNLSYTILQSLGGDGGWGGHGYENNPCCTNYTGGYPGPNAYGNGGGGGGGAQGTWTTASPGMLAGNSAASTYGGSGGYGQGGSGGGGGSIYSGNGANGNSAPQCGGCNAYGAGGGGGGARGRHGQALYLKAGLIAGTGVFDFSGDTGGGGGGGGAGGTHYGDRWGGGGGGGGAGAGGSGGTIVIRTGLTAPGVTFNVAGGLAGYQGWSGSAQGGAGFGGQGNAGNPGSNGQLIFL